MGMRPRDPFGIAITVNSFTPSRIGIIDSMRVELKDDVAGLNPAGTSLPPARSREAGRFLGLGIRTLSRGSGQSSVVSEPKAGAIRNDIREIDRLRRSIRCSIQKSSSSSTEN